MRVFRASLLALGVAGIGLALAANPARADWYHDHYGWHRGWYHHHYGPAYVPPPVYYPPPSYYPPPRPYYAPPPAYYPAPPAYYPPPPAY